MTAKKIRLTKKKSRWVGRRDVNIKGDPLRPNITTPQKYEKKIARLINSMHADVRDGISELLSGNAAKGFIESVAQDASLTSAVRILMNRLSRKYDRVFSEHAKGYAQWLAEQSLSQSKRSLGTSLKKLSGGLTINTDIMTGELKEQLNAAIEENTSLIKSIKTDYLDQVRQDLFRSITNAESGGLSGLQSKINELLSARFKKQRNRAKNIALDQTRKIYNNINAERMKAVGINKFQWNHSGGSQNPREDHIKMDGNIYSFDDLPVIDKRTGERGIPGQAINCKCFMTPVIEFENGEQN